MTEPRLAQGLYYVSTGIWPLIHLRSFLAVTGPKRDTWLVQTFGVLVSAVGLGLLAERRRPSGDGMVGLASAVGIAAAELVFVAKRRISPVYLGDAAVEAIIALAWLRAFRAARRA